MGLKRLNRYCIFIALFSVLCLASSSCGIFTTTFHIGEGVVKTTYKITKITVKTAYGTSKVIYIVGKYTFKVVMAPITWPLTRDDLESIDGMSPKEAIRLGRVKMAPYVVNGKRYVPMSLKEAKNYKAKGIASWYGNETRNKKGGHMTADGEVFDPDGLNAAHKYLPLPTYVRVINLENGKSVILRVNDRGPFVKNRIIDVSAGAAKKLGFFKKGTARVEVETVKVKS